MSDRCPWRTAASENGLPWLPEDGRQTCVRNVTNMFGVRLIGSRPMYRDDALFDGNVRSLAADLKVQRRAVQPALNPGVLPGGAAIAPLELFFAPPCCKRLVPIQRSFRIYFVAIPHHLVVQALCPPPPLKECPDSTPLYRCSKISLENRIRSCSRSTRTNRVRSFFAITFSEKTNAFAIFRLVVVRLNCFEFKMYASLTCAVLIYHFVCKT